MGVISLLEGESKDIVASIYTRFSLSFSFSQNSSSAGAILYLLEVRRDASIACNRL